MKKHFKKILVVLIAIVVAAFFYIGNYFYNFALNPEVDKSRVVSQDASSSEDRSEIEKWFNDNKNEVQMTSVTGNNLTGYKFENPDATKWVFVVHGYSSSALKMSSYIKHFYDMGYNVFAPDLISHGKSEGDFISMGGFDSKDLAAWVNKLSQENNNADTLLFGISMGAATVMNTLDENLPTNVKAFIEDSGYLNVTEEFTYQLKKLFGLPSFPVIPAASTVTKIRAGYFLGDVDATEALKTTKLPALVLHGEEDGFVPPENSSKVYDLLTSEKEIHTFPDSKHVEAERKYREQYWNIVKEFLDKHFN